DGRLRPLLARAEESIRPLAPERGLDPGTGLGDLGLVVEKVGTIAKALEPVGNLLPAVFALARRVEPGVPVFSKKPADLAEVAVKPFGLKLELLLQPSLRMHGADRQLDERAWRQWRTVSRIESISRRDRGSIDAGHRRRQRARRGESDDEGKTD